MMGRRSERKNEILIKICLEIWLRTEIVENFEFSCYIFVHSVLWEAFDHIITCYENLLTNAGVHFFDNITFQ